METDRAAHRFGLGTGAIAALEHTFLITAALILCVGRRTCPGDVAAAIAEESAMPASTGRTLVLAGDAG